MHAPGTVPALSAVRAGTTLDPMLRTRSSGRRALVGVLVAAMAVAGACLPQDRGEADEVPDGADAYQGQGPPQFPETGPVSAELLVEGLVYDFTSAPNSLDLWVPPVSQARCAAENIVATLTPARLSELGYRPATSGASLNDIDLTSAERDSVSLLFQQCVDMTQAVASLLAGNGRMSTKAALCMARGLEDKGLTGVFADAWAFGREVDPFDDDLADTLLQYAAVCLPGNVFNYPGVDLPGDDEVDDAGDVTDDNLLDVPSTQAPSDGGTSSGSSEGTP